MLPIPRYARILRFLCLSREQENPGITPRAVRSVILQFILSIQEERRIKVQIVKGYIVTF